MHKKKIGLITLGLICMLGITGCTVNAKDKDESTSTTKEVEVTKGDIREEISLSGSVKANKVTTVNSSQKSTIEEVYVDVNEYVTEGEDIVLLENGNVIEAPFDGKISKMHITEGDEVDSSNNVFNIVDISGFKIETSVDESEITKVSKGQSVEVTVTALDKEYEGVVTSVDGEATESGNSTTFGVIIELNGDFADLYTGMSSEMNIVIKESKDVLVVPVQAIKNQRGKYMVTIKNGNETKEVEVSVGAQDSSFVEITSGLKEGDVVVYEQAQQISNKGGNWMMPDISNMKNGEMPMMPSGSNGGQMNRPSGSSGGQAKPQN